MVAVRFSIHCMTKDIEPYVVPHESICINGVWYDVENAYHWVIGGQEYIWLEDQLYELHGAFLGDPVDLPDDEPDEVPDYPQYEPPPRSGGWGSTIVTVLIILFVVGAGLKVMKVLDHVDDAISRAEASVPSSVVAVGTATPKPTSAPIQKPTQLATPRPTRTPVSSPWDTQASKVVEAMDYTNPTTRDFALTLIDQSHSGSYNIAQICDMWEKIYKRWTYVNDPKGFEYFSPASRTIKLGLKGDCDDFAILTAASIQAIGGSPRIIVASNTNAAGHAYAEVYLGPSKSNLESATNYICKRYNCKSIAYRVSNEGGQIRYWLNLDWQAKHPGGPYYQNNGETVAIYPNKYWVRLK